MYLGKSSRALTARLATATVFVATITKLLLRQTHNTQLSNTHYGFTTMLLPRNVKNYRDLGVFTKRRKDCARICKARPGTDLHALTERVTWLWQAFVLLARHANTKGDDGTPFRALRNSKSAISVDILQNPSFCDQDWRICLLNLRSALIYIYIYIYITVYFNGGYKIKENCRLIHWVFIQLTHSDTIIHI